MSPLFHAALFVAALAWYKLVSGMPHPDYVAVGLLHFSFYVAWDYARPLFRGRVS